MKAHNSTLTYIGHATAKLVTAAGTVIYIDPAFQDGDYTDPADIILITHAHSDHDNTSFNTLNEGCQIIKYSDALQNNRYKTYIIRDVTVEAVPAGGNKNHSVENCVGYIITFDGLSVYHAGDTSYLDSMSSLSSRQIDYALYPIDGIYNMDAVEATLVAKAVNARISIPIHEIDEGDTKKSDNFTVDGKLVIPYGESIYISAK